MVRDAGVELRLHSWFSEPMLDGDRVTGAIFETPAGRQAIRAKVVIDASGDAAVAARSGAPIEHGRYFVTLVHRYGGGDTQTAPRFEVEHPEEPAAPTPHAERILGG